VEASNLMFGLTTPFSQKTVLEHSSKTSDLTTSNAAGKQKKGFWHNPQPARAYLAQARKTD
jgi:hypothetical protein